MSDAADSNRAEGPARPEFDRRMLEGLVCPLTQAVLSYDAGAQELISRRAGLAFPIRSGIPILLIDEARRLDDEA
ncbi:Trm112 family protein [Phaeovulum sp. W22_SRMD_FR3]|uniref:Trm112 family protein n=1 Tax=Phaeovulum sp. W22_SRMD_FR3 TaxID=3240274 RepID=UPI003F949656